ncbi:GNAT family N-acetyltransferase [Vibrio sagamiensis]|uniref:N-acetyltransferase n=1 Tax=Vibrio sagamiensis NBRC 104589 TaxID=1219064 RepID=A0A511QAZ6_9VIBR|nr:GNAT family protein [Vibrio sagamiensis]GEM74479.1 N-acetyltransferase [Vibrio sagamiensis NBRC 104589]
MWLQDIQLESEDFKLIPMQREHASKLISAASDGQLWDLWFTSVPNKDSIQSYIDIALEQKLYGTGLPFVVIDKRTECIVGSTRFCSADLKNKRVEIGYTWYSKQYQRSSCNTTCKKLMLEYAFEQLGAIAVELRTNWHNHPSRAAIARLGAKQDGVLRNHQKLDSGGYRDTVVFSIINSEWPAVKIALEYKLNKYKY